MNDSNNKLDKEMEERIQKVKELFSDNTRIISTNELKQILFPNTKNYQEELSTLYKNEIYKLEELIANHIIFLESYDKIKECVRMLSKKISNLAEIRFHRVFF